MRAPRSCSWIAFKFAALSDQNSSSASGPGWFPSLSAVSGSVFRTPLIWRVQVTTADSSAWIWSASDFASDFFPGLVASATAFPETPSFSLPGEALSTEPPSLDPELIPPASAGGSGSSVLPLVWPMVTYTLAMNLCRFSTTSLVITSGHPTWFAGLVIIGRNTSFAKTERCSSGTSPKSP